ncbi:hypothetical protein [Deinococcus sp.]|uniref:hypothetical protein n=1 Tax=Deinococcus sp. TaxID=47478 RepID=UPI003C7DC249
MTSDRSDGPNTEHPVQEGAPEMETAEGHSGSDHVSHGANSNLAPAATQTEEDERAARDIEQQHKDS